MVVQSMSSRILFPAHESKNQPGQKRKREVQRKEQKDEEGEGLFEDINV